MPASATTTGIDWRGPQRGCATRPPCTSAHGHWVGGEALQPEETALTVRGKNGKAAVTDGPYTETKEQLGGILLLEARDMNHAVELMSQHPAVRFGNIFEIRPVGDMSAIQRASERRRGKRGLG